MSIPFGVKGRGLPRHVGSPRSCAEEDVDAAAPVMEVSKKCGSFIGSPRNKDHGILGSVWGTPFIEKTILGSALVLEAE